MTAPNITLNGTAYRRPLAWALAILMLLVGLASASEEDYAPITKLELTAKTTDNTFGTVVVQAETYQGQDGIGFSSFKVIAKGKTMSVPKDVLAQASRATFMTMTISSEVGYPGDLTSRSFLMSRSR